MRKKIVCLVVLFLFCAGCQGTKWNRSPRTNVHNIMEHTGTDWFSF